MKTFTPFRYCSLPWKIPYLTLSILRLLLIQFPILCFSHLIPSLRPRPSWPLTRTLLISFERSLSYMFFNSGFEFMYTDPCVEPANAWRRGWVRIPPAREKVLGEVLDLARRNKVDMQCSIGGYWYGEKSRNGEAGARAEMGEKLLLYFHSGGYVMGMAADLTATQVITGLLSLHGPFRRLLSVEYHVSTSAPYPVSGAWPAALVDAISSYTYVLSLGFSPKDIVVCGDSAGGHLAFALVHYLVNHPETNLPPPAGLILISPAMDFALTSRGPESSYEKHRQVDGIAPIFESQYSVHSLRGAMSEQEFQEDPLLSPGSICIPSSKLQAFFRGMSRTFIHGCGVEILLDSIRVFKDRMLADNGEKVVTYMETREVVHDLLVVPQEPERSELLQVIGAWLKEVATS